MGLKISARDSTHSDPLVHLSAIYNSWLPLSNAVLDMVVNLLPSPLDLTIDRVQQLICPVDIKFDTLPTHTRTLTESEYIHISTTPVYINILIWIYCIKHTQKHSHSIS